MFKDISTLLNQSSFDFFLLVDVFYAYVIFGDFWQGLYRRIRVFSDQLPGTVVWIFTRSNQALMTKEMIYCLIYRLFCDKNIL
jgi:hypothetical protein